jgi:hypothetical protein
MVPGCLAIVLALAAGGADHASPTEIESAGWLQGCWEMVFPGGTVEEMWMPPRGGTMMGLGRTVRGDSLDEYELLLLRETDGALAYEAHPSGQGTAVFLSRSVGEGTILFENPEHDYPQRIGYERRGADSLIAWIEGTRNGQQRRIAFPYRRIPCGGD